MGFISKLKAIAKYVKYDGKITQLTLGQITGRELLLDKKIIITGGSSGIGLAMAKKFLSEGSQVVITGRNKEKLKEAEAIINNPNLHVFQWDVAKTEEINDKLQEAINLLGGLDAFVNNAAFVAARKETEEFWDSSFDTNAKALYFISKRVAETFENDNAGRVSKILNISSLSAL